MKMITWNMRSCGFRTVVQLSFINVMVIWKRACPYHALFKTWNLSSRLTTFFSTTKNMILVTVLSLVFRCISWYWWTVSLNFILNYSEQTHNTGYMCCNSKNYLDLIPITEMCQISVKYALNSLIHLTYHHLNNFSNHFLWLIRPILTIKVTEYSLSRKKFFSVLQVAQEEGNVKRGNWRGSDNWVHPVHNSKTDFILCSLTHTAIDSLNHKIRTAGH